MIAPSITFDPSTLKPMSRYLTEAECEEMIRDDVAELHNLLELQAEVESQPSSSSTLVERIRIKNLINGLERAQDAHWSWLKEIQDARDTATTSRPSRFGAGLVGTGN